MNLSKCLKFCFVLVVVIVGSVFATVDNNVIITNIWIGNQEFFINGNYGGTAKTYWISNPCGYNITVEAVKIELTAALFAWANSKKLNITYGTLTSCGRTNAIFVQDFTILP